MNIIFDEEPGKIYDIFNSLWFINNYEYAMTRKKNFGIYRENRYEIALISMVRNNEFDIKDIGKYFPQELQPQYALNVSNIWGSDNISEYLTHIKSLDKILIREAIINSICSITEPDKSPLASDKLSKYTTSDMDTLNFIEDKDISSELKWEIFSLLKDSNQYISEYVNFIYSYIEKHKVLEEIREIVLKDFNQEFKEGINNFGIDFLNEKVSHFYGFDKCKNIYIMPSAISSLIINDNDPENCYVVIGPYIEDVIENQKTKDNIENSLSVVKTICDNTRFNIIKLLQEKDHYGQELVDALNLSKSTISHHMFYLSSADVINVDKDSQKFYYSLNTDELAKNFAILIKELGIELEQLIKYLDA